MTYNLFRSTTMRSPGAHVGNEADLVPALMEGEHLKLRSKGGFTHAVALRPNTLPGIKGL